MDDEWDYDDIVDLDGGCDVSGDPTIDRMGYQSPRRKVLGGYVPSNPGKDWQAQAKADRRRREQRREEARRQPLSVRTEAQRAQSASRGGQTTPATTRPVPVEPLMQSDRINAQPYGAYFERRRTRRWWMPWTRKTTWTQVSSWRDGEPPKNGVEVVTVSDVAQLPGRVRLR